MEKKTICLLGATGFLGTTIFKEFVENNYTEDYNIRLVVRSHEEGRENIRQSLRDTNPGPDQDDYLDPLREIFMENIHKLGNSEENFHNMIKTIDDITNEIELLNAIKDCSFVIHAAGFYPERNPDEGDELEEVNVEGTRAVLEACRNINMGGRRDLEHGNIEEDKEEVKEESKGIGTLLEVLDSSTTPKVERIVYVSDICTLLDFDNPLKVAQDSQIIPEETKGITEYIKSKIRAEKVCEEFTELANSSQNMNHQDPEILILHPGFMVGGFKRKHKFTSAEIIRKILFGKYPGLPQVYVPLVGVEDVALCALNSLNPEIPSDRKYPLVERTIEKAGIGEIIKSHFGKDGKKGCKPTSRKLGKWTMWLASFFTPETKYILKQWKIKIEVDEPEKLEDLLKGSSEDSEEFQKVDGQIYHMCKSILEDGYELPEEFS